MIPYGLLIQTESTIQHVTRLADKISNNEFSTSGVRLKNQLRLNVIILLQGVSLLEIKNHLLLRSAFHEAFHTSSHVTCALNVIAI